MAGYNDFPHVKPHTSINNTISRLNPRPLSARMKSIIKPRKVKNFYEKDFDEFMVEVAVQAEQLHL